MEPQKPLTQSDVGSEPPLKRSMTLAARLLNVFAVPGEVFAELKGAPAAISNWLAPAFFGAAIGVLSVLILLSQPSIQKQFKERQDKFIAERAGQLTPKQQIMVEWLNRPAVVKSIASTGAVIGSFGSVVWWGFVLWFLGRTLFRVHVPFSKTIEVAGLAMMINVLGGIVAVLLILNPARVGESSNLVFLIKDFDSLRKGNLFGLAANVFSVWLVMVRAIGLAKLADVPYLRAAWAVFAFWVLEQSLLIMSGAGQLAM